MIPADIFAKVNVQPGHLESKCWIWTGYVRGDGYGQTGKHAYAHRESYEAFVGPIPDGTEIDHLCNPKNGDKTHRACVNPAHLEAVPPAVNTARGDLKNHLGHNGLKTHCPKGHLYDETNTRIIPTPQGTGRACKECGRMSVRARRARAKQTT